MNFFNNLVVLVGNKDDMPDRKVVLTEDAQRFASQMGIQLFETSAKDNKNVEEMFNAITQQVLLTKKEQKEQASNLNDTIMVGKGRKPTKKSKCCWKYESIKTHLTTTIMQQIY